MSFLSWQLGLNIYKWNATSTSFDQNVNEGLANAKEGILRGLKSSNWNLEDQNRTIVKFGRSKLHLNLTLNVLNILDRENNLYNHCKEIQNNFIYKKKIQNNDPKQIKLTLIHT